MLTTEIKDSLRQTLGELRHAEDELNRPLEDVVTLSLCLTARKAMNAFMRNYLLSKNILPEKENSLQELLSQCQKTDTQFNDINISKIFCNSHGHTQCEDKHCLSHGNVEECVSVANSLKVLVLNKLQLNESELV